MIGQVIQATKVNQNAKKGPLSHQKMKCLFLDYIQILMISQAIQDNESQPKCHKMPPKSS